LDILNLKTARIELAASIGHLTDRHACSVLQHVADGGQILVVDTLARYHRNRLRNVLKRLFSLANGRHAGGVGL
jgi:hypothetical protein